MNYFEHHIRDYDTATSHLTWEEDLAYTRLIRWYYRKEKPVPADVKEACRLMRAVSKAQRDAVASVLNEFFELREDGWHNDTCDQAIRRYLDGEPEREVKKANEDNRLKRHRDERAALFKVITDAGLHAPWNIAIAELRAMAGRVTDGNTATQRAETATPPETAPATPATATQSPPTNHQSPITSIKTKDTPQPPTPDDSPSPSAVGAICIAMRAYGINADPGNMLLRKLATTDVTVQTVQAACEEAKRSKPNQAIGPAYVIGILMRWSSEAAALNVAGAVPPRANGNGAPKLTIEEQNAANNAEAKRRLGFTNPDDEARTIDAP